MNTCCEKCEDYDREENKVCFLPTCPCHTPTKTDGLEERFENAYGSFQLCDVVNQKDHDRLLSFIRKEVAQARKEEREKFLRLIDEHDPSVGRTTSPAYWGNTLREALRRLQEEPQLTKGNETNL